MIIRDNNEFLALKEEWDDLVLESSANCLFLAFDWMYTWWMTLSADRKLHLLTVRDRDGRLIAIAPMTSRPPRYKELKPFRVLEFLGSGNVGSDYLSILIRDGYEDAALSVVADSLAKSKMVLDLSLVERTSTVMIKLAIQLSQRGWDTDRTALSFSPFISLYRYNWESYLSSLSTSHRRNFRKKLKRVEDDFDVSFEYVQTESQREAALRILVELHLKRWNNRGGSNALHNKALVAFHTRVSQLALMGNYLRLYVLRLDDMPAAAVYGFDYNGVFYYYQAGFDPAFSAYSVGLLALGLTIRASMDRGLREFDMLHGEEEYKYLWAEDAHELVRLDLFPPSILGTVCRFAMSSRKYLKKAIWPRLPASVRELREAA